MIDGTVFNTDTILRSYLVANTPAYLFRHFRLDPSVRAFAAAHTPRDAIEFVKTVATLPAPSSSEAATAYACLVSLLYMDRDAVSAALEDVDLGGLEWAPSLLGLYDAFRDTTKVTVAHARQTLGADTRPSSIPTNTTTLIVPGEHNV